MRKRQYRSPLGLESTVVQMRPEKSASPFALSRKAIFVGAATLAVALSATAALAQNCGAIAVTIPAAAPSPPPSPSMPPPPPAPPVIFNAAGLASSGISAAAAIAAQITAANTAFLTQSTAFVSAQPDPKPGDDGGGVWTRGVGGDLTLKSNSSLSGTASVVGVSGTGATTCNTKFSETFAGFQVGQDIAKLNIGDGWNIHIGTTAGSLEANGNINGGSPVGGIGVPTTQVPFSATSQAPFVGTYLVATRGSFFADALIRYDNYDLSLNSPLSNLFNQKVDAHGYSASGSAGYNYQLPNSNWFVEPSAGVIWSNTSVGALNVSSGLSGTGQINSIASFIGRAGLRVGTTVEAGNLLLQPFLAASIWHDFTCTAARF